MKTLILILALFIGFTNVSINAQSLSASKSASLISGNENFVSPENKIYQKIQNTMRVPSVMKEESISARIRVVFTIDETGKAHVLDVATKNEKIRKSVINQFEAIDFADSKETQGQEYSIWLNFKVL